MLVASREESGTLLGPVIGTAALRDAPPVGAHPAAGGCVRYVDDGVAWPSFLAALLFCPCVAPVTCCCGCCAGGWLRKRRCVQHAGTPAPQQMQREAAPSEDQNACLRCMQGCSELASVTS